MRGAVGSTLTLTMLRGNATEPHVVELDARGARRCRAVRHRLAAGRRRHRAASPAFSDDDAGASCATRSLAPADATARGRVVLDLRNCAGGPLAAGIDAARLFVASGTIGQLETRGATRQTVSAAGAGDGAIAAAAGRARGQRHGRAGRAAGRRARRATSAANWWANARPAARPCSACSRCPTAARSGCRTPAYLTVPGEPIHERGVQPDVVVEQPDVEFGATPPLVMPPWSGPSNAFAPGPGRRLRHLTPRTDSRITAHGAGERGTHVASAPEEDSMNKQDLIAKIVKDTGSTKTAAGRDARLAARRHRQGAEEGRHDHLRGVRHVQDVRSARRAPRATRARARRSRSRKRRVPRFTAGKGLKDLGQVGSAHQDEPASGPGRGRDAPVAGRLPGRVGSAYRTR